MDFVEVGAEVEVEAEARAKAETKLPAERSGGKRAKWRERKAEVEFHKRLLRSLAAPVAGQMIWPPTLDQSKAAICLRLADGRGISFCIHGGDGSGGDNADGHHDGDDDDAIATTLHFHCQTKAGDRRESKAWSGNQNSWREENIKLCFQLVVKVATITLTKTSTIIIMTTLRCVSILNCRCRCCCYCYNYCANCTTVESGLYEGELRNYLNCSLGL